MATAVLPGPPPPPGYIQPRHLPPTQPRGWPAANARASRAHQPTCYFPINLLWYITQLLLLLFKLFVTLSSPLATSKKEGWGAWLLSRQQPSFHPSRTYGLLGWTRWIRDGENGQIWSFFIWDSCFMLHADNSMVSESISNIIIFLFRYLHRLTLSS